MIEIYESSKRLDDAEPKWILSPYDMAYDFVNGGTEAIKEFWSLDGSDEEICKFIIEELSPLLLTDGTVVENFPFPPRIIHDGFKFGTTSWVFMGRNESEVEVFKTELNGAYGGKELFIISRKMPIEILEKTNGLPHPELSGFLYCGYFLEKDLKVEVGPCHTIDGVINAVNGEGLIKIRKI
ncbi:MAG: hypothetical protein WCJ72_00555 [Chryseobacterium sp.]